MRGQTPGFTSVDAVNAIRRGKIVQDAKYNLTHHAWQYEIADLVDGYTYVLQVILHCDEDYEESPLLTVLNCFFRRGRRREVREKKS